MDDQTVAPNADRDETPPTAGSAENARRNPEEWVTGDGPMTEAQAARLRALCQDTGEAFEPDLSKAHASERIAALQRRVVEPGAPRVLMEDQTDG